MSKALKDAIMTVGVRVLLVAAGLATTIITARWLGPAGRGDYFFVVAFSAIAGQIVHLGLHASNAYYVARDPTRFGVLAVNSYWISAMLGSVSAAVGLVLVPWLWPSHHGIGILCWALILTPTSLATLLIGNLFVGAGKIAEYNLIQLMSALLPFLLICGVALYARSAQAFLTASALASLLNHLALGVYSLRGRVESLRFDIAAFRIGLKFAVKAYVTNALCTLSLRAPALMFGASSSPAELGYFSVASQVFDTVSVVPASVAAVAFPALMKLGANRWAQTRRYLFILMGMAGAVAIVMAIVAGPFVDILFGSRFAGAVQPIRVALVAAVFVSGTSILSQFLATHGMPKSAALAWLAAAAISFGCGPWLIGRYGAIGASLTLSAATFVAWVVLLALSLRQPRHEVT